MKTQKRKQNKRHFLPQNYDTKLHKSKANSTIQQQIRKINPCKNIKDIMDLLEAVAFTEDADDGSNSSMFGRQLSTSRRKDGIGKD